MADVVCMGELLIDFVPTESGVNLIEAPAFKKAPGGAPANVAVGLAKLGVSAAFMGKVGDDPFGHFLAGVLQQNGVDTTALRFSRQARTALAFVSLGADGERSFMFYRHPSADMLFSPEDIDATALHAARLFHYGSISLISEPSRSATLTAVALARENGCLISYDPNLRLPLWPDETAAKTGLLEGWPHADFIKASEEEITFLSGQTNLETGVRQLWHEQLKLLTVTQGAAGCTYFTAEEHGDVPGFRVTPVDTTGAGDAFVAGLLAELVQHPTLWQDPDHLTTVIRFANAVGALTTTQRGAIPALPTRQAVDQLLHP